MKRAGILFGMENTFPPALVDRLNGMSIDVHAELLHVGGVRIDLPPSYDLIIDRISQDIPFYRSYLKNAALHGTIVLNDPLGSMADDRFYETALAARLGINVPKAVLLPSKMHPSNTTAQSMRNLEYPLPWKDIFAHIGFPALLKSVASRIEAVRQVYNESEFFSAYDQTGDHVMMLQQAVEPEDYVRCYCIGQKDLRTIRLNPLQPIDGHLAPDVSPLEPDLEDRIARDCLTLTRAFGYDLASIDFAIRRGVPIAVDGINPVPDADYYSIGAENFSWVIDAASDVIAEKLSNPRRAARARDKAAPRPRKKKAP